MEPLNFNLYNLSSTYKFFLFYRVLTLHTQIYSRQINFIEIIIIIFLNFQQHLLIMDQRTQSDQ